MRLGKKIDKVEDSHSGISIDIYLEKGDMLFSAQVFGNLIQSKDGADLKRKIWDEIRRNTHIEWQLVILVRELTAFSHRDSLVGIEKEKEWWGKRQDGKWLRADWSSDGKEPSLINAHVSGKGDEFKIPSVEEGSFRDEKEFYLPYSVPLWASLDEIENGINRLKGKLREILGSPEGIEHLKYLGGKLTRMLTE